MARTRAQLLEDILAAAAAVDSDVGAVPQDEFRTDETLRRSVTYSLGIIRESVRVLLEMQPDIEDRYPQLPWRQVVGFRNRVFHAYWDTMVDVVWDVAHDLHPLVSIIRGLHGSDLD